MPELAPAPILTETDPALLRRLGSVKRVCLVSVGLISFINLCAWLVLGSRCAIGGGSHIMLGDSALAALLSALSLGFSERRESRAMHRIGFLLAAAVGYLAVAVYAADQYRVALGLGLLLPARCGLVSEPMAPQVAGTFALLAASLILVQTRKPVAIRLADAAAFVLCLLVLILISSYLFGVLRVFGLGSSAVTSPQTLLCLALLTQVAVLRRAENGVFSIFLARGIGSRIARALIPVFLVLQFVREAARAHLEQAHLIPAHYATAVLASVATMVSLALLLLLARHVNRMEMEIQDLSLRDALTGLYNLRGFVLLAEQALRLAQRSRLPFSVLFIDLDDLKQINDSMGHEEGSAFLTETGQLLKSTFREADVIGRIGGDEFAVAGHFTQVAMSIAAERLKAATAEKNRQSARRYPLSLSVGFTTAKEHSQETLKDLLTAADAAMYEEKRRRKVAAP
jgi:diguanylate cyclase (GGDEF)-like protein